MTVDELSTTAIFKEYATYVWRVLRRLGVSESDVEDCCQEVFMVIHRRLGEFEGRSSLRTWLYGICVRVASDYRKRASRRYERTVEELPEQLARENPHEQSATNQALVMLDRCLDELDQDKREVFVLYEIEELSMNEVAEALACPLQTAYSRLHAARDLVTNRMLKLQSTAKTVTT